jgi:hypothetical protein
MYIKTRSTNIYPNWDFCFENISSGIPDDNKKSLARLLSNATLPLFVLLSWQHFWAKILQGIKEKGWPDWANFRLMDDCLLWAIFSKIK